MMIPHVNDEMYAFMPTYALCIPVCHLIMNHYLLTCLTIAEPFHQEVLTLSHCEMVGSQLVLPLLAMPSAGADPFWGRI